MKENYLGFVQYNVRRYGWQSFGMKLVAALLTSLFILIAIVMPSQGMASPLKLAFGVGIVFLMWIVDGHYSDMQKRYAELYRDAISTEGSFKMMLDVPSGLNVGAMWRPITLVFYVPMMVMLALVVMSKG